MLSGVDQGLGMLLAQRAGHGGRLDELRAVPHHRESVHPGVPSGDWPGAESPGPAPPGAERSSRACMPAATAVANRALTGPGALNDRSSMADTGCTSRVVDVMNASSASSTSSSVHD